jgi:nuclear GTP-binding protein
MVKMLNGGKAVRDRDGKIIKAAAFQAGEKEALPGRIRPDRRWFGESSKPFIYHTHQNRTDV